MLKQSLQYKLQQKLSPQQIQLMKLIQLPTLAFEQRIKQELEENIALEGGKEEEKVDTFEEEYDKDYEEQDDRKEDDFDIEDYLTDDDIPDYKTRSDNYSDEEEKSIPYAAGTSFHQYLKNQLNTFSLNDQEYEVARFLVGSIDDSGYIRRDIPDIVDDLAFTQNIMSTDEEVENILKKVIHKLDPIGIGARDLKETLYIQLKNKKTSAARKLAMQIIDEAFEHFVKKHYKKIIDKFDITEKELKDAIEEIEHLNPKPGGSYVGGNKIAEQIIPDFTIRIIDGELELSLNSRNAPQMHVSATYSNMLKAYKESKETSSSQRDAVQYIKQKLDAAKWFIDAVRQRQETLLITMSAIMNHQKEYFLTGDVLNLKPMILKDIADEIGMDVSTVSRVANSKYVHTPYGTKLIKEFFSESMTNAEGEEVSTREIKKILEMVIAEEDKQKPYTDEKLAKILKERGYPIARRTVAKYREQLDLPVARLRKKL